MPGQGAVHRGFHAARRRREILMLLAALGGSMGCATKAISFLQVDPEELMSRWNAVADGVMVQGFGNFHWDNFDQFPHPTFKGGSVEAYTRFAEALLAFYEAGDNFQYLTQHKVFTFALHYGGNQVTTFEALTALVLSNGFELSAEAHQKLEGFYAQIEAVR
jgi:hypothetical protein